MTAKVPGCRWLASLLMVLCNCAVKEAVSVASQAQRLHEAGNLSEAYPAYGRALCAQPGDLTLARGLVEVWFELGQPGSPAARLSGCRLEPGVQSFVEGLSAAARGGYQAADALLVDALAASPPRDHDELLYRRGLLALQVGRPEAARDHLDQAAGLAPTRVDIRLALCQAHRDLGQLEVAAEGLRHLTKIPVGKNDLQRGRRLLHSVVRANEPSLPPEAEGPLRQRLSAMDRAETNRNELLDLLVLAQNFEHPRVLTVAGLAALRLGALSEGARLLRKAAELNPLDPDPLRALGVALLAAQRANEAVGPLRGAFSRDPFDPHLSRQLARAAETVGDRKTAMLAYRRLVALEPTVTDNHLRLARCAHLLGDLAVAGHAVQMAYDLDRLNIPVLLERAVIFAKLAIGAESKGERLQAEQRTRETIDELLALAPEHPGAAAILQSLEPR